MRVLDENSIVKLFDSVVSECLEAEYHWIGYDSQVRDEEHGSTIVVTLPISGFLRQVPISNWCQFSFYWMHPLIGLTLGNNSPYSFKEWYLVAYLN
jgi:hypothetical protein